MYFFKKISHIIACSTIIMTPISRADEYDDKLPDSIKTMLNWELHANSFNRMEKRKSAEHFDLEHVEIPLSIIKEDTSVLINSEHIAKSLLTETSPISVRWILNPEDTSYRKKLFSWLRSKNQKVVVKKDYFRGHLTASRSLIVQDKLTNTIFSAKVSTNNTGGGWRDKGVNITQANKARKLTDFVQKQLVANKERIKHIVFLPEPMAFFISDIKQSMIIRSYDELIQNPETYYLPGFSALHPSVGLAIAQENGSDKPRAFWKKHYSRPLARAFAEFQVYFGMSYESAHSQQFLIEMSQRKPTGRIVFRDYNDAYALESFPHPKYIRDIWLEKYKHADLQIRFGLLKAIKKAQASDGWITPKTRKEWGDDFFKVYEDYYTTLTGISVEIQNQHTYKQGGTGSYLLNSYFIESPLWKFYFSKITQCYANPEFQINNHHSCQEYLENPTEVLTLIQKESAIPTSTKIIGNNKFFNYLRVNALSRVM